MALHFYESNEDQAIDPAILKPDKPALAPYITYVSVARAGGKAMKVNLPQNWDTIVGEPANEIRVRGVATYDGHAESGTPQWGDETWFGYSVYIPTATNFTEDMTVMQWHPGNHGKPPIAVKVTGDGRLTVLLRTGAGGQLTDLGPATRNVWHDIVVHFKLSSTANGRAEVWLNGVRKVNFSGITVNADAVTTARTAFLKYGIYVPTFRNVAADQDKIIYVDEVRFGNNNSNFAEVDPAQAGEPPPTVCAGNIITNGDFAGGATGWTATSDGAGAVVSGEYHVSGTIGQTPFNQLHQAGISLTLGQAYRVSFKARNATLATDTLRLSAILDDTPFTQLGLNNTFTITNTADDYATTFVATATTTNARFRFTFDEGDFYIDNVCLETTTATIEAEFEVSTTTPLAGSPVVFDNTSFATNGITGYLWEFGDGDTATTTDATHTYATAGTYSVKLTITGPDGTDTFTKAVVVGSVIVTTLLSTAERFLMNGAGTVTQISSHPQIALRLLPPTSNALGEYAFSFNVFSGVGQIKDLCCDCRTLYFNIDTGAYRIVDCAGTVTASGSDSILAIYGAKHPLSLDYSGTARGQAYWEWAQARYAGDNTGYTAQAWPSSLQAQMDTMI